MKKTDTQHHPQPPKGGEKTSKHLQIMSTVNMFYNAKPHIFEKAKALRDNMTLAEKLLWKQLSGKKVLGLRFRPQHPIDIFIADFYCHPIKFVIEIDGGIHQGEKQNEYDIGREADLNKLDIDVIRFTNEDVINHINDVVKVITEHCKQKQNPPPTP